MRRGWLKTFAFASALVGMGGAVALWAWPQPPARPLAIYLPASQGGTLDEQGDALIQHYFKAGDYAPRVTYSLVLQRELPSIATVIEQLMAQPRNDADGALFVALDLPYATSLKKLRSVVEAKFHGPGRISALRSLVPVIPLSVDTDCRQLEDGIFYSAENFAGVALLPTSSGLAALAACTPNKR